MALPKRIEVKTITRLITAFSVMATIAAIIGTGYYIAGVIEHVSSPNKVVPTTKGQSPTVVVLDGALLKKITKQLDERIGQPLPDDSQLNNPFLPLQVQVITPPPPPSNPNATE